MRLTILTIGSLGDVRPYVALGRGLQAVGHVVCVATHRRFESLVRSHGLKFAVLVGDPHTILDGAIGQDLLRTGGHPVRLARDFMRITRDMMDQLFVGCRDACNDSEAILCSATSILTGGFHVAEHFGVPLLPVFLQPLTATTAFSSVIFPQLKPDIRILRSPYNWLSHVATDQIFWQFYRKQTNLLRCKMFNLEPTPIHGPFRAFNSQKHPIIYGYSPSVLPHPPDWGYWHHVTGYWFLESLPSWRPPASLVDFLSSGPPPVLINFGSMASHIPAAMNDMLIKALRLAQLRGIVGTGSSNVQGASISSDVYMVGEVSHDWLLPQVAAVVHHGGQGTTAAVLRAGVPSITVPLFSDQPFWGQRVNELGAGVPPIAPRHLSIDRLAAALQAVTTDTGIHRRAAALGRRIRAENGVKTAVDTLQQFHLHG